MKGLGGHPGVSSQQSSVGRVGKLKRERSGPEMFGNSYNQCIPWITKQLMGRSVCGSGGQSHP